MTFLFLENLNFTAVLQLATVKVEPSPVSKLKLILYNAVELIFVFTISNLKLY